MEHQRDQVLLKSDHNDVKQRKEVTHQQRLTRP
jgi:hypothetical protein